MMGLSSMERLFDQFKNSKSLVSILILIVLIVAIPVGLKLIQEQQIFKSKATVDAIVIKESAGVFQRNGQWFVKKDARISLELTSPLGPVSSVGPDTPISTPPSNPTPSPNRRRIEENKSYTMSVLVIKYFPLTADGNNIDISVTGDVGESYEVIKRRTDDVTNALRQALERASTYLGYKDSTAKPSLRYNIIDTNEYTQAVPIKPRSGSPRHPDYNSIMAAHNICDWVDNKGIREVWLWAYQGPNQSDGQPYLGIAESKMAGPYGDISNSFRYNDMPVCKSSYRVYTFNYGRFTAEALESWGHQLEAEMDAVDRSFYRDKFQGSDYPQTIGTIGRCGSVHNPPNARYEYDRGNSIPNQSDCLDWNPDNLGTLSNISCQNWGCSNDDPIANNFALNYQIWLLQNMPGLGNTKTYQGKKLRNWWDVHGDFDEVMGREGNKTLFID